jgi:hypothetical protein
MGRGRRTSKDDKDHMVKMSGIAFGFALICTAYPVIDHD